MSSAPPIHDSIAALQDTIRLSSSVHVAGNQTKNGFHSKLESCEILSTRNLQGIVSYDPQEFVVTVLAGTPVAELVAVLFKHGQYLPFDPMFANRGATIGGTVASNCAGSCRFRYGGVRDFLIGVRFLDGAGNFIRGGGQVVKNAAGFDYPKLMVGSAGKLGVICELTFKVFPRPQQFATLIVTYRNFEQVMERVAVMTSSPMDIEAIDVLPHRIDDDSRRSSRESVEFDLAIRFGGLADAMPQRIERLQMLLGEGQIRQAASDESFWDDAANLQWVHENDTVIKMPTTLERLTKLEQICDDLKLASRYCVGGNIAWIAVPAMMKDSRLLELASIGRYQIIQGLPLQVELVREPETGAFGRAIKRAIDPENKFR